MDYGHDHPLAPVVAQWREKIRQACDVKRRRFGKDAEDGMAFFAGPYNWLYDGSKPARHFFPPDGADLPQPTFKMSLNKTAELVQLFGPALYHRNPIRQVNPRKFVELPPDAFAAVPAVGQNPLVAQLLYEQATIATQKGRAVDDARAAVLSPYLNYTPDALDLKTESRWAIDEAIIKGMGLLYPEVYQPPGAPYRLVGSFFDSVDNLVIDPDATSLRDAKWVARRCVHPVWEVEREYRLPPGSIRGNLESFSQTAEVNTNEYGDYFRKQGQTSDLLVYWKVYSKMGLGGRLKGVPQHLKPTLDSFGDFVKIVVCDECPFPLNTSPAVVGTEAISRAVQWETPYWADDGWPFVPVSFHSVPGDPWPLSHLSPGMGELKFLNWLYSFIASKIAVTSRDFIAYKESLHEEVLSAVKDGKDLTFIKLSLEHGRIDEIIQFLQHPEFNKDIWLVAEAVAEQFDRRTGLTELMYGQSARQMRSAEEANVKSAAMNVRPDDMANKVEDAMGALARAEALCARWHLTSADVRPVLGGVGAWYWDQFVHTADPSEIVHSLEYRIEAGSARKPNKARDSENMRDAMQNLFPPLMQLAAQGVTGPVNALITDWAKSIDLDASRYLIPALPLPMPAPTEPAPGEGAAA